MKNDSELLRYVKNTKYAAAKAKKQPWLLSRHILLPFIMYYIKITW